MTHNLSESKKSQLPTSPTRQRPPRQRLRSYGQPGSYAEPEVRFGEDRLYFVEITDKREPIEFLRGTSFSFHLVSN